MTAVYTKNKKVTWKWGQGEASGTIQESHKETITKTIKGSEIVRHGSDENPAYVIKQDDGSLVVKLHSELET